MVVSARNRRASFTFPGSLCADPANLPPSIPSACKQRHCKSIGDVVKHLTFVAFRGSSGGPWLGRVAFWHEPRPSVQPMGACRHEHFQLNCSNGNFSTTLTNNECQKNPWQKYRTPPPPSLSEAGHFHFSAPIFLPNSLLFITFELGHLSGSWFCTDPKLRSWKIAVYEPHAKPVQNPSVGF